ncbi:MAG: tetratricopeptide repeat protein, partial [Anaerolineae bacterium]|nr:tetratricopeptide repeat protein [Anaerolineae bacterium]
YMILGRYRLAAADYTRAIELNPDDVEAYYGRIEAYMQAVDTGNPPGEYDLDNALADAERTVELADYNAVSFLLRGKVHGRRGDYEAALEDLNRAIDMASDMAWTYVERGYVYGLMDNFEAARSDYVKAIELDPNDLWPYAALGDLLYENGRRREALIAYRSYLERAGEEEAMDYVRERVAELSRNSGG